MKKGFIAPLIILTIFLVIAVAGPIFYWRTQIGKGISDLPEPTPSPTLDETANWKTYANTKQGIEFKYPSNFEIKENEFKETFNYFHLNIYNDPNEVEADPSKYFLMSLYIQGLPKDLDLIGYIKEDQYFDPGNGYKTKTFEEIKPYSTGTLNGYYYFGGYEYMMWHVFFEKDRKVYEFAFGDTEAGRFPEPEKSEPNILDKILTTFKFAY